MVVLLLADGFEEIEALTPVDVLRRAGIEVVTYSINGDLCVCGAHNIMVGADDVIENINYDNTEAVILPGGMPGADNLENSNEVQALLEYAYEKNLLMCAICAAPKVFGKFGYLQGKRATCFPGFEQCLEGADVTGNRVEADCNIITSKGMGTAMDFSLAILENMKDKEAADKMAVSTMYK